MRSNGGRRRRELACAACKGVRFRCERCWPALGAAAPLPLVWLDDWPRTHAARAGHADPLRRAGRLVGLRRLPRRAGAHPGESAAPGARGERRGGPVRRRHGRAGGGDGARAQREARRGPADGAAPGRVGAALPLLREPVRRRCDGTGAGFRRGRCGATRQPAGLRPGGAAHRWHRRHQSDRAAQHRPARLRRRHPAVGREREAGGRGGRLGQPAPAARRLAPRRVAGKLFGVNRGPAGTHRRPAHRA